MPEKSGEERKLPSQTYYADRDRDRGMKNALAVMEIVDFWDSVHGSTSAFAAKANEAIDQLEALGWSQFPLSPHQLLIAVALRARIGAPRDMGSVLREAADKIDQALQDNRLKTKFSTDALARHRDAPEDAAKPSAGGKPMGPRPPRKANRIGRVVRSSG